jgi:hypothetical protein
MDDDEGRGGQFWNSESRSDKGGKWAGGMRANPLEQGWIRGLGLPKEAGGKPQPAPPQDQHQESACQAPRQPLRVENKIHITSF